VPDVGSFRERDERADVEAAGKGLGDTMALDTEKIARYLESAEWNLEQAIKVGDYRATQAHAQVSIAASNLILVAISLAAKDGEGGAQQ
jgi:UBA-like domain